MTFAFKIIAKSIALAFKPGLKKQSNEARILNNFVNYYQITKLFKIQELWLLMIPKGRVIAYYMAQNHYVFYTPTYL